MENILWKYASSLQAFPENTQAYSDYLDGQEASTEKAPFRGLQSIKEVQRVQKAARLGTNLQEEKVCIASK
jgi:hypothetical protein